MSLLSLEYRNGGLHLPRLGLWMDAPRPAPGAVFVSHAHSDHTARHREIIASQPTAQLMRARLAGRRKEHILPFGAPRDFCVGETPFELTLLPAGHILGSAMAYIEAGGESLLYTGDFKLRCGLTAEPCHLRKADILVMETTFGQARYRFPPAAEMLSEVMLFCQEALENEQTPVLFAYSLGKGQEILRGLMDSGIPVFLHEQVFRFARIYEDFGVRFPLYQLWEPKARERGALIWPYAASRSRAIRPLSSARTAALTGWAMDAGCRFRHGVDAAFPLSDHADFDELVETVSRVSPHKVYTVHGFAAEFALTLREMGVDAQALGHQEQLTFPLGLPG